MFIVKWKQNLHPAEEYIFFFNIKKQYKSVSVLQMQNNPS